MTYYDDLLLFPQDGFSHTTMIDIYESSNIMMKFTIDQIRILDLTINIKISS